MAIVVPRKRAGKRRGKGSKSEAAQALLRDLISALGICGGYAVTHHDGLTGSTVHCAFKEELDAAKFADVVRARRTGRHGGWESQTAFFLDGAAVETIKAALATTRRGPS